MPDPDRQGVKINRVGPQIADDHQNNADRYDQGEGDLHPFGPPAFHQGRPVGGQHPLIQMCHDPQSHTGYQPNHFATPLTVIVNRAGYKSCKLYRELPYSVYMLCINV